MQARHTPISHSDLEAELARLSATSGPVTSLTFQLAQEVKELEEQAAAAMRASGALPRWAVPCRLAGLGWGGQGHASRPWVNGQCLTSWVGHTGNAAVLGSAGYSL